MENAAVEPALEKDVLLELEERILNNYPRAIRLEKLIKNRNETLEEFLKLFFYKWNENRNTIYADDNSIQTPMDKRRSLGDIFMISRYYYPNCSLREVLNLLYNVLPDSMEDGFRSSYCHRIHKRVWYYDEDMVSKFYDETTYDEYGNMASFYRKNI